VIKLLKEKSNLLPASLAGRQTTTAAWGQKFNNIAAAALLAVGSEQRRIDRVRERMQASSSLFILYVLTCFRGPQNGCIRQINVALLLQYIKKVVTCTLQPANCVQTPRTFFASHTIITRRSMAEANFRNFYSDHKFCYSPP
jgi:hypothetical protein